MNFLSNISTRKNSVNSSLATIKLPKDINETINKNRQKCKTRFSHQQQQDLSKKLHRNSSHKQKMNIDCFEEAKICCMNHTSQQATHVVLQNSQNPMYYCQRCAILIASKGFNITPLNLEYDKENKNKMNSKRPSFCQQNKKQINNEFLKNGNSFNQTKYNKQIRNNQPIKVHLSNEIISQLQQCWRNLKSGRQSNLNQIDIYINTLNENIDFLQDFYYVLHQYVEKQKNIQLKEILSKKQLLQQLRSQVSNFFIKSFTSVKELKDNLINFGESNLDFYQQVMNQANYQKFSLNFQAALEQVTTLNHQRQNTVHMIGEQITQIIKNTNCFNHKQTSPHNKQRNSISIQDHKPVSYVKKPDFIKNCKDQQPFRHKIKQSQYIVQNPYEQRGITNIHGVNNVQSSVRSLQLSFDNSENQSNSSGRKVTKHQETNNFTLNQYINHRGEQSYSNLLLTSTDMN